MNVQPKSLLKYAEELLQSYSRLIVYSGDILRSLPEPREGLSVANIKPKKDESTAFMREWQHLEAVFDEYLIRLNDIRARAHEELEAARVRCLAGEDMDLTLPEAAIKLNVRLEQYKRQYDALQHVLKGGSFKDVRIKGTQQEDMDVVGTTPAPDSALEDEKGPFVVIERRKIAPDPVKNVPSESIIDVDAESNSNDPSSQLDAATDKGTSVDMKAEEAAIQVDSSSDMDNDEGDDDDDDEMEDMFQ